MRRTLIVIALLTVLTGSVPALATPTQTPTNQSQSHTLVIEQVNGSVGYTITVSGSITIKGNEPGDAITGQTASGRVGGLPWKESSNDSKDVIRFTGELRDFEYDGGKIRITLDGKPIDPDSLVGTPPPPPTTPSTRTPTSPTTTTMETPSTTTETPTSPTTITEAPTETATPTARPTKTSPTSSEGESSPASIIPTWIIIGLAIAGILILQYINK